MQYHRIPYEKTRDFCIKVFQGYGFTETESTQITDVLLDADLCGIEHGKGQVRLLLCEGSGYGCRRFEKIFSRLVCVG